MIRDDKAIYLYGPAYIIYGYRKNQDEATQEVIQLKLK